jgi:5-keto 4-deoxyuronate isomerase
MAVKMYLDGLMAFSAVKSVPKEQGSEELKTNPLVEKFTNPLTLNMCMCQLEMGMPKKSLAIVDNLIKQHTKKGDEKYLWNCFFKKGIILDRTGDPDQGL